MPVYDRHCGKCDELFDVRVSIADKETARHECPYCGSFDGEYRPSAVTSNIRPDRMMTAKKDNGFKEVLSKIQERNKRTEICKR